MQKYGFEIFLFVLGVIAIGNVISPFIKSIEVNQGPVTALVVLGIIGYLLLQKHKI